MTAHAQTGLFSMAEIPLPQKSENTLAARAMLRAVSISAWDGYKYDQAVSEEIADIHNAAKDVGRYRKRLLPRRALKEVTSATNQARKQHAFFTLPWGDDNYRILPAATYFDHLQAMKKCEREFFGAVTRFEMNYERLVNEHHELGTMFKIEDYPGMREDGGKLRFVYPNELRKEFSFEVKIQPMPSGDDFRASVGDAERDRIRRQITESVHAALRTGTKEIWQRLYEPVSHMAKCMAEFNAADKDKKPKLYDSMINNIVKVLDVLPKLNLEGDGLLDQMAEEVRTNLIVERKELRKSQSLSAETANRAAELARRMAAYMGVPDATTTSVS